MPRVERVNCGSKVRLKLEKKKSASAVESTDSHPSCSDVVPKTDDCVIHDEDNTLFERIYSDLIVPKMPNCSWAIHRSPLPNKTIVASELTAWTEHNVEVAPLYIKQIVFDQKLNFEVFFVNTKMVLKDKPSAPQTVEEFEHILAYIDNIKLCPGGPAVTEFSNVSIECAYKDPTERWRHNLCSLEAVGELVCKSCFSLQEILQRHVQRNKVNGRSLPYSRTEKRKVPYRRAKRI
ncbi:uncharacterized protein LOC107224188 [Neodiprion lecontei]|uniref:Uncharacterized protein LOC107224188 n=1 Tax=Neodiprion lecontei TaxID=441921 RepID=A0A6J0BZD5_NEOLC|nr:uncharacterized protein LOC107224188 [Neodiprion lecontei]